MPCQFLELIRGERSGLAVALPGMFVASEAQLDADGSLGHFDAVALEDGIGVLGFFFHFVVDALVQLGVTHVFVQARVQEVLITRTQLSAHEYPREIHFVDALPLTTTGKVIRRHLREQLSKETLAAGSV